MFDHVTVRVTDLAASRRFYETLLQRKPSGTTSGSRRPTASTP